MAATVLCGKQSTQSLQRVVDAALVT